MNGLWGLAPCVLCPLVAALIVLRHARHAQTVAVCGAALSLVWSTGLWLTLDEPAAGEPLGALSLDRFSAPLLPMTSLIYLLTFVATLRTKMQRFSFSMNLTSLSITLATLACRDPWGLVALLALGVGPVLFDLHRRGAAWRGFALHMGLFVTLLVSGSLLLEFASNRPALGSLGAWMLIAAVLLRCGAIPVHGWMPDLFQRAGLGAALLFVAPMTGAYAAVRLVLPIATADELQVLSMLSLLTAVYTAGLAMIQSDARRLFCYLFLSHSSLVLVGLETGTVLGLTGGLAVWLGVSMSLAGFGLTLRSLESRTGRLSLDRFHGLYERTPSLASLFLLTGLASVGFPGTIGFVATEILVDAASQAHPQVGLAIVLAAALNGIAVIRAYFRLFTGVPNRATISLASRGPERLAVLTLGGLIVLGGLVPQPGITSRYRAAAEIVSQRGRDFSPPRHALFGPPARTTAQAR